MNTLSKRTKNKVLIYKYYNIDKDFVQVSN